MTTLIGIGAHVYSNPVMGGGADPYGPELVVSSPNFVSGEWTAGAGWSFTGGTAQAAFGTNSNLEHNVALVNGETYHVVCTVTQALGSVTLLAGATTGTTYSTITTFEEDIVYTTDAIVGIAFDAVGFFGNLSTISIKKVL